MTNLKAAVKQRIENATAGELETIIEQSKKILDDLQAGKMANTPMEQLAPIAIEAAHLLAGAEAKLNNKGWFFKTTRLMQLTSVVFNALGTKTKVR